MSKSPWSIGTKYLSEKTVTEISIGQLQPQQSQMKYDWSLVCEAVGQEGGIISAQGYFCF